MKDAKITNRINGLIAKTLPFTILLPLISCQGAIRNDVLDDLGKQVLKSKEGIDIEIKPESK